MRRRKFITLVGGAATWPLAARAQQATKVARIGFLSLFSPSAAALWHRAFLQSLSDLGWVEGKTFDIEYRYAEGRSDRLPELITDLIRLKVDVIVASGTNDTLAAKNATREIPIVMAAAGEPVGTGIVESLAHPGGNITGLSQMNPELTGGWNCLKKSFLISRWQPCCGIQRTQFPKSPGMKSSFQRATFESKSIPLSCGTAAI